MAWISFGVLPCRGGGGGGFDGPRLHVVEKARFAWHASFRPLQQEKTCNSAHEQIHLSNDTVESILRHREVGRAKNLSAPLVHCMYLIETTSNVPRVLQVRCHWEKSCEANDHIDVPLLLALVDTMLPTTSHALWSLGCYVCSSSTHILCVFVNGTRVGIVQT